MMQCHRGYAPHRTGFALYEEFAARCGQGVLRTVEGRERPGGAADAPSCAHARRFLVPCSIPSRSARRCGCSPALAEWFYCRFRCLRAAPGFDAQRLRRPDARQLSAFREGGELIAGNNTQVPFVVGTGMRIRRCAVVVAAFNECRPRVAPDQRIRKDRMDSALFPRGFGRSR